MAQTEELEKVEVESQSGKFYTGFARAADHKSFLQGLLYKRDNEQKLPRLIPAAAINKVVFPELALTYRNVQLYNPATGQEDIPALGQVVYADQFYALVFLPLPNTHSPGESGIGETFSFMAINQQTNEQYRLVREVEKTGQGRYYVLNAYKGVLKYLFQDWSLSAGVIAPTVFTQANIIGLFKQYAAYKGGDRKEVYEYDPGRDRIMRFLLEAGTPAGRIASRKDATIDFGNFSVAAFLKLGNPRRSSFFTQVGIEHTRINFRQEVDRLNTNFGIMTASGLHGSLRQYFLRNKSGLHVSIFFGFSLAYVRTRTTFQRFNEVATSNGRIRRVLFVEQRDVRGDISAFGPRLGLTLEAGHFAISVLGDPLFNAGRDNVSFRVGYFFQKYNGKL